jgi:hypothetical protein
LRPIHVGGEGHDPSRLVSVMIYYKSESRIPSILGSGEVEVGVKVDGVEWFGWKLRLR